MSGEGSRRMLVPVSESVTLRNTVAYVVRRATESNEPDGSGTGRGETQPVVHFVFPSSWRSQYIDAEGTEQAEALLNRVRTWVAEDLDVDTGEVELSEEGAGTAQGGDPEEGREPLPISVTTAVIAADEYLFSPRDYADTLLAYAREHDLDHIVLDPEYQPTASAPLLSPLEAELDLAEGITWEEAPSERAVRGRRLLRPVGGLGAFVTVFGLSFLFYQVIGGFAGTFDVVTGAVSAALVAAVLSGITFTRELRPRRALMTTARWVVFVPYLFWEIAKANVQVVYVVLHPSLPIDPSMERFRPAVPVGLPVTTLANSITLTPGTVTVDVRDGQFFVHALTGTSREGIYSGALERATRFVFFGRAAARFPSPRERGQADPEDPGGTEEPVGTDPDARADGAGDRQ